jgi:L-alanine-DL-glutamate epimerase-like enolase superfamily enzyme
MPRIVEARACLADIAVETVLVDLVTDDGNAGTGYAYTIGTGGSSVLAMLRDHLLPRLVGADATRVEHRWHESFASTRATTVGAITSLALAAGDTALWDLRCQRAGEPLWRLAGGFRPDVPLYDTEGGWLHLSTDELVRGALAARDAGWPGVKLKVGKANLEQDAERLRAVRDAVGPSLEIMVDANQSMTAAEARRRAAAFEPLSLAWFEEPLPADDVSGHAFLARSTSIPIAVGESLYSVGQFRDYLHRGAASVVQVDVARVGGITPWLKVAHLAEAFNVPVCPHFLMELHVSLVAAIPNGRYVEHIPQLRAITRGQLPIADGQAIAPDEPGLGIAWDRDAIEDRRVA